MKVVLPSQESVSVSGGFSASFTKLFLESWKNCNEPLNRSCCWSFYFQEFEGFNMGRCSVENKVCVLVSWGESFSWFIITNAVLRRWRFTLNNSFFKFFFKVLLNLTNRSSSLKGNDLVTEAGMFVTAHITSLNNIKVKNLMYIHIKKNWHLQPRANVYLLMMELFFRDVNMWKHETLLHPLH